MNINRKLLTAAYLTAKGFGLFYLINKVIPYASILMFHRVNDHDTDCLSVRVGVFDEMLHAFKNNYNVISLAQLVNTVSGGQKIEEGTVVITFDDGYKDNFSCAVPLLVKYGLPATFFVTSRYIGTDRVFPWDLGNTAGNPLMNWDEVRELSRMGFDIGGHTSNHVNLGIVPIEEARREIVESKLEIEAAIGRKITSFAYPFGAKNNIREEIYPIIREAGFTCCCSGYGGKVTANCDAYRLTRVPVYQTADEMLMEIDNFMIYYDGRMRFMGCVNP